VTYRIEVTEHAQQNADAAYEWLVQRGFQASEWFDGLDEAIASLAELPMRCGLARESAEFDEPVRQLLYGKIPHVYRVLFVVRTDIVYILHIRHRARQSLRGDELTVPPEDQFSIRDMIEEGRRY
jgi:plasmid stabilization system protein ParE